MSSAEQQCRLLDVLGPGDITLELARQLPPDSLFVAPMLRGRLLCSSGPYMRLCIAFAQIETLVRAVGQIPRG